MSTFWELLDEYLGDSEDITDIRVVVRRLWFYDFDGYPIRVWSGQGKLHSSDGNEWLGTIDSNGNNLHKTPSISDGRDGSSAAYNFTLNVIDLPGRPARELYDAIKSDQWRVKNRKMTCYLAIFKVDENEGLRPTTPIVFFKEFIMQSPRFSEKIELTSSGQQLKRYSATILAKDNNFGRSNVPGGTYADTIQKERAKQLGVPLDRGSEFLASLANRTFQRP